MLTTPCGARVQNATAATWSWSRLLLDNQMGTHVRCPQVLSFGGWKTGLESRRGLAREGRYLSRAASSFASNTASQKEVSACHSSSLRTMACAKPCCAIAPTRIRRCSPQARHSSIVNYAVSPRWSTQW
ncbi:hypothetical protein PYW08_004154 [Mythimna loreyi]|uniref:Uncharacterized protein n=1 Tax=Mythimna loreyi TaxID=667449 RepID=A0ACC2QUU7_9NEOP|nr:hypothetical protein PYW08_004154 [Mythimna loreyi]